MTADYARYAAPMRALWTPRVVPRTTTPARSVESYNDFPHTEPPSPNVQIDGAIPSPRRVLRETDTHNANSTGTPTRRLRHSKSTENLQKMAQSQPQTRSQTQSKIPQSQPSAPVTSKRLPSNTSSRTISPTRSEMKRPKSGPLRRTLRKVLWSRPSEEDGPEKIPRPSTTGRLTDRRSTGSRPSLHIEPCDEMDDYIADLAPWVVQPPTNSEANISVPYKGLLRNQSKLSSPASLPRLNTKFHSKSPAKSSTLPVRRSTSQLPPKPSLISYGMPSANSSLSRKANATSSISQVKAKSPPRSYNSSVTSTSPLSSKRSKHQIQSPRRDSLELTRLPRHSHDRLNTAVEESSSEIAPQMPRITQSSATKHDSKSPETVKVRYGEAKHRSGPRAAMENLSIIARLDEIEMKIAQIEGNVQAHSKADPEVRIHVEERTMRMFSDTSSVDDASGPRTPTSAVGSMDMHPMIVEDEEEDERHEDTAERLLRHSLLQKGQDTSIQRMIAVLATEHNARVTLESELNNMRGAIAKLHQELQNRTAVNESRPGYYGPTSERAIDQLEMLSSMQWQQQQRLQSRFSSDSSLAGFPASSPEKRVHHATAGYYDGSMQDIEGNRRMMNREVSPGGDEHEVYHTPQAEQGYTWP